jgi:hypothetical protein
VRLRAGSVPAEERHPWTLPAVGDHRRLLADTARQLALPLDAGE